MMHDEEAASPLWKLYEKNCGLNIVYKTFTVGSVRFPETTIVLGLSCRK